MESKGIYGAYAYMKQECRSSCWVRMEHLGKWESESRVYNFENPESIVIVIPSYLSSDTK